MLRQWSPEVSSIDEDTAKETGFKFHEKSPTDSLKTLIAEFNASLSIAAEHLERQLDAAKGENARLMKELQGMDRSLGEAAGCELALPSPSHTRQQSPSQYGTGSSHVADKGKNINRRQTFTDEELKSDFYLTAHRTLSTMPVTVRGHLTTHTLATAKTPQDDTVSFSFTDPESIKDQMRKNAGTKAADVTRFYKESGIFQRVARNERFEATTLSLVLLNSIWLAIDIDLNGAKSSQEKPSFFKVVEMFFFVYFLLEILIRFGAFYHKYNVFMDFWFQFDACLVFLMVLDEALPLFLDDAPNTSVLRVARLVKICRLARMAKIFNRWPELLVLIRGIGIAVRSVLSSLVLMLFLVYMFAVIFRYLVVETPMGDKYFPSVFVGMKWLVLTAAMPDAIGFIEDMGEQNVIFGILIFLFVIASSLTLLNMLIGVLCEVITGVSAAEREGVKIHIVKEHLMKVFAKAGFVIYDETTIINRDKFQTLMLDMTFIQGMRDVNVDPVGLIDFIDFIFKDVECQDHHGVTFLKFVEMTVKLGGTNVATVKDVIDMRQVIIRRMFDIERTVKKTKAHTESMEKWLRAQAKVQQNGVAKTKRQDEVIANGSLEAVSDDEADDEIYLAAEQVEAGKDIGAALDREGTNPDDDVKFKL
jgi:hypothetical protein